MTNDRTQENYIAAGACGNIDICQGRGTRIVWVYMDDFGSALLRLHHIRESNRMGLGHVTAHDQYCIAIHKVLRKCSGPAASKRCTQTGYGRAMSYTSLVLNRNDAEAATEELLHQIVLFDVQGRTTECGYGKCMVDLSSIGQAFNERLIASLLDPLRNLLHRPVQRFDLPMIAIGSAM